MSCLAHAAQLEREREKIEAMGARIIAVGPGSDASADRIKSLFKLHYQLFGDRRASVYGLFGFRKVLAVIQQSGTVVIDRQGIIRYLHRTPNPQDALRMKDVLAKLSDLTQNLR